MHGFAAAMAATENIKYSTLLPVGLAIALVSIRKQQYANKEGIHFTAVRAASPFQLPNGHGVHTKSFQQIFDFPCVCAKQPS